VYGGVPPATLLDTFTVNGAGPTVAGVPCTLTDNTGVTVTGTLAVPLFPNESVTVSFAVYVPTAR
jgi:hypothetical protein